MLVTPRYFLLAQLAFTKRHVVTFKGSGNQDALAWSSTLYDSGRWYFEMEYVCKGCVGGAPAKIDVGIFWTGSKRRHRPAELINGDDYFYGIQ